MGYCSYENVVAQLGESKIIELTDDSDSGVVDMGNFNACLASADRIIDGYCQSRYTVPFAAPVPALITEVSIRLTVCKLFARKRQLDETIKAQEAAQLSLLAKINEGKIQIGISDSSPVAPAATAAVRSRDKIFDSDMLDKY